MSDLLLCTEHEEQVEADDQTHIVRTSVRPVVVVGSVLMCGGGA